GSKAFQLSSLGCMTSCCRDRAARIISCAESQSKIGISSHWARTSFRLPMAVIRRRLGPSPTARRQKSSRHRREPVPAREFGENLHETLPRAFAPRDLVPMSLKPEFDKDGRLDRQDVLRPPPASD